MEEGQAQGAAPQEQTGEVLGHENTDSLVQTGEAQVSVKTNDQSIQEQIGEDSAWFSTLDPAQQEYVSKKGFKDPKSVLNSYINLEKLRGVPEDRLLKIPEKADDPGWGDVYKKLGRPDNSDGYTIENIETDEAKNFAEWASKNFHELNMTQSQAQGLVERYENLVKEAKAEHTQKYEQDVKAQEVELKKEWGAAYHQNIAKVQQVARELEFSGEVIESLEREMGFDGVMKFMHKLSAKIGEGKFHSGDEAMNPNAQLSPEQARAKIDALKSDRVFVDKYLSGDAESRDQLARLHKFLQP